MNSTTQRVAAADRRAAQFLIPSHETPEACAASFKRAVELLEVAAVEFFHAGRQDLAGLTQETLRRVEQQDDTDAPQL